ncbi:Heterokaryon incompatibility protein 6, OR allele [Colletotrichum siamense]|nr:Heterokaryon incompatibility protein 6, OR allele [Colletotrichum siamense]
MMQSSLDSSVSYHNLADDLILASGPEEYRWALRCVTLLAGCNTDDVRCTLRESTLGQCNGKYEALSYTWGDPNDRTQIYLDDRPFSVTANLESALRCLRLPDTDRVLWTDSICINQKNVSEVNIQVQRMWAIYKYSSRVVVFLGREAKGTTSIAGLLTKLTTDVSPKDYRAITSILQDKYEAASWKALDELMKRPWWSRAWIVQEFAVHREVVFICGTVEIPESIFGSALEILVDYRFNAIVPKPLQYFVRHIASTPISHLWTVRRAYQKHGLDGRMRDPANMLYRFRGFKSFDPRDKVYSLFRLMGEDADLKPDYNRSVQELYKDVVRVSIKMSNTLQVLCHHNRTIQGIHGLPTWCPDWTVMRGRRILLWPNGYNAGGNDMIAPRFEGDKLYLKGKLLDRVQWLETFDHEIFYDNAAVFRRLESIETEILRRSEASSTAEDKPWPPMNSFHATLVGSRIRKKGPSQKATALSPSDADKLWHAWYEHLSNRPSNELRGDAKLYNDALYSALCGRSFVLTEDKHFGLADIPVQVGDWVGAFAGSSVLFAVREATESSSAKTERHFELVGEW